MAKLPRATGETGTTELVHLLSSLKSHSAENTIPLLGTPGPALSWQAQDPSDKVSRFPLCVC